MPWRWPRTREKAPETRDSGGEFTDAVLRLIESTAAGTAADTSSTAAVEAAAGALSRAFAAADVDAPSWVQEAVTPAFLAQVGRDLVRAGVSMHVIRMSDGGAHLIPAASWHWEGGHDPASWTVRATAYGPSTSTTWQLPASSVIFVRWGSSPGQPYIGSGPLSWAAHTAKLQAEIERSLADEAAGPLAQIISVPQDGGDGGDDDPLAMLKADIAKARGKAVLVETTQAGWDQGRVAAPQKDWSASRLGPSPPDAVGAVADGAFARMLAACGCSPALFDDSDGTAKREALRQWHMGTVQPLARMLAHELTAKLSVPVHLRFDTYPLDLAGRAQAFQKLVAGGMPMAEAVAVTGLLAAEGDA